MLRALARPDCAPPGRTTRSDRRSHRLLNLTSRKGPPGTGRCLSFTCAMPLLFRTHPSRRAGDAHACVRAVCDLHHLCPSRCTPAVRPASCVTACTCPAAVTSSYVPATEARCRRCPEVRGLLPACQASGTGGGGAAEPPLCSGTLRPNEIHFRQARGLQRSCRPVLKPCCSHSRAPCAGGRLQRVPYAGEEVLPPLALLPDARAGAAGAAGRRAAALLPAVLRLPRAGSV